MIALDSCCWIERWKDPEAASTIDAAATSIGSTSANVVVPAIVIHECRRWLIRNVDDDLLVNTLTAQLDQHDVVVHDAKLAVRSALLATTTGLATADAIILATCRARMATLLTFDRDFDGLPGVLVIDR